jgi:hypothetical protein
MGDIGKNLRRYLEMEALLNAFFSRFGFCWSKCIKSEIEKAGNNPVAACCTNKYYSIYDLAHPAYERLSAERKKRFGKPEDHTWINAVSVCEYHNPSKGCLLFTHKSPTCLSFMCPEGIRCLRNAYGIYTYDYLGVYFALDWILTGIFSEDQYLEFKHGILDMTAKVDHFQSGHTS